MKSLVIRWCTLLILALLPAAAGAAPLTAYVEPFSATEAGGDRNLSAILQTLLKSRLSGDAVQVQDSAKGARVIVKGTYIPFGKVFSIDITACDPAGSVLARAYEQAEGQEAVPTAISKLAEKLTGMLLAAQQSQQPVPAATPTPLPGAVIPYANTPVLPQESPDIVRTESAGKSEVVKRLTGVYIGLAQLRTMAGGEHELALLQERSLHVVRHGATTTQLAEAQLGSDVKALTVDTADLDGDGLPEIYLTVMRGGELASQVWVFKDSHLTRIANNLPYFFRVLAAPKEARTLYAQQMGRKEDFLGPVFEVKKTEKGYELQNPLKLPRFANIFNFNRFTEKGGKGRFVVLHPDGFLLVYTESGEKLWQSNDKYGGTELYLSRDELQQRQFMIVGPTYRKVFLEQRISVKQNGEIVVSQNGGPWVIGNSRSYSKNTIYAFTWNGLALNERWHTKVSQNYLADYYLDEELKEILMLEVVNSAGIFEKGASAITIKKLD